MKKTLIFAVLLLSICRVSFAEETIPVALKACDADADCIVVELGCGQWEPIAMASAVQFLDEYSKKNPICDEQTSPNPPNVNCFTHVCSIATGERRPGSARRLVTEEQMKKMMGSQAGQSAEKK